MRSPVVRFTVLGPVRAWRAGVEIDLGPPQQRATLAVLLVRAGQPVALSEIVDVLWREDPPASALNVVHRSVGRLRRLLEPGLPLRAAGRWLLSTSGGYRFSPGGDDEQAESDVFIDLLRFRELCRQAREAASGEHAVNLFLEAVQLRQGPCAAGTDPQVRSHPLFAAIDREYSAAVADLADAALRCGTAERVLPIVREAAADDAWDEPLHARLMLALAACGRQAEALAVYEAARTRLCDELGIDPGPELRAAQEKVLRQQVHAPAKPDGGGAAAGPAAAAAVAAVAAVAEPVVRPAQLPADLPAFVGRGGDLSRVRALLGDARAAATAPVIVAVDGMAGIGKTTLAAHCAHELSDQYPDGQLYVNLRGFDPSGTAVEPGEAVCGFLEALGVAPKLLPAGLDAQAALYRSLLAGRRLLIVLDNARDVDQVRPLLPGAAGCLVLVTSRNRLTGLVAAGAHAVTLDVLTAAEARQALTRRLGSRRVDAEPAAVADIVAACGSLPLALAVVAARAAARPDFPLSAFAEELRETAGSLDAFAGDEGAADPRIVFSWSYRALSPDAARLFRLLATHRGPDIAATAAASLAGRTPRETRPLLAELVRAHLLDEPQPRRYAFHDLLRAYATELAEDVDTAAERREAVHRMLDHYLHTAVAAERLFSPHREPIALPPPVSAVTPVPLADAAQASSWFMAEYQALHVLIRQAPLPGFERYVWQLTWTLLSVHDRGGHWLDWADAEDHALAAAQAGAESVGLAHVYTGLGIVNDRRGHDEQARRWLHRALEKFTELGDTVQQARVHIALGAVLARIPGRQREAIHHEEQSVRLHRAAGHRIGEARALNNVGFLAAQAFGEYARALDDCRQALAMLQELGDIQGVANAWDSIAYAHAHLGQYEQAVECYQRAVDLQEGLGDRFYVATSLIRLGDAHHEAGHTDSARTVWRRALAMLSELGHPDAADVRTKLQRVDSPQPRAAGYQGTVHGH